MTLGILRTPTFAAPGRQQDASDPRRPTIIPNTFTLLIFAM
jgi:hypothetical protein